MSDLLILCFGLIGIGYWGLLGVRGTVITIILSLELLFMGISFLYILMSFYLDDIGCQVFALVILITAAAESTIILSIFVAYQRLRLPMLVTYFKDLVG